MKSKTLTIILILFTSIITTGIAFPTIKAQEEAVVYVDPPEVLDLPPSEYFTIQVKVENITNLYGIDIQLGWDPTIIRYVNHTVKIPVETYPDGILHSPVIPVKDQVDENASMPGAAPGTMYWLSYASILPAEPFTGSGIIFEMTFHVVGIGSCPIRITYCMPGDPDGNPIPVTTIDGYFSNYVPTPADIYVSPPSIIDSSLTPSNNFTIDIQLENVVDFYAFEFWLAYNSTILEVKEVTVNPVFPPPIIEQYPGMIKVGASLEPPAPSISGNLTLATIEFHVLDVGESPLDLFNVTLLNSIGEPIPYNEPGDGYFNNMLITRMFVNPPELIDPTLKPGDIFSIYIAIENAVGISGYEFKLGYDNTVLTCLGVFIIPLDNYTNFDSFVDINETEGVAYVKVQYYPIPLDTLIEIYEPQNVTEIRFQVQDYGQTVLDLYDADIYDQYGNSMNPVVEDGFFATLLRDVAIISVNITSQNIVYPGRIVTIDVTAMNRGNMTTETFDITLYYDTNIIGVETVTLEPWSNTTITFYWNTTGLEPCNNFTIWAEASQVPYETNLENNVYVDGWVKIKMIGDVDGNGVIDILDLILVSTAYGSREGDPNWNPDADVASPWGVIDILDLVTISSKYGTTCP